MDRMTVFISADNEAGYVLAVISEEDYPHFVLLGFVDSIDDLTPLDAAARNKSKGEKS